VLVLGFNDQFLNEIEKSYPNSTIAVRGNRLKVEGPEQDINEIEAIIEELTRVAVRNNKVTEADVLTVLALHGDAPASTSSDKHVNKPGGRPPLIVHTDSGESIVAKTPGQKRMVSSTEQNDIVFSIGPAGTGKTFTSVALAVKALKSRSVKKIVLARPAVEAGENLGFLPGEKIDPYLRPLYDALEEMLDRDQLQLYLSKNIIEIAPLAYMRGRTLNNAFVILDEAQNATNVQMKMFLTRLGFNSRAIITGDITQTDLPHRQKSGLISIQKILKPVDGISFVYLDERDVVRHKLVRDIINAYDKFENEKSEK